MADLWSSWFLLSFFGITVYAFGQWITTDSCFNWRWTSELRKCHSSPTLTKSTTLFPSWMEWLSITSSLTWQITQTKNLIIGIKLDYLRRNKLPRIIFVLMCKCDYIISHVITGAVSSALIDENCHKRCSQVVMGHSIKLKRSIDDQTIIDNCQISKMKIGYVESINGSYLE